MTEKDEKTFALRDFKLNSLSSSETIDSTRESIDAKDENINDDLRRKLARAIDENAERGENPVFKTLAEPVLPAPVRSDRARLQMQSPTRLHFYWSLRANPFETARRVFGARASDYTLVVKLFNERTGSEEMHPVEAEGSWWFDVDADASYRAEIGFYRARRPFARLLSSNRIETPRRNPSPRAATDADWSLSANAFAEVLDASGFTQDAFEVALAGDDFSFAERATQTAFAQIFGADDFTGNNSSELRFALLALAAGYAPGALRGQISHSLFSRLNANAATLNAEKARAALRENFNFFADENAETEFLAPTVFGASLINFPRSARRRFLPKLAPLGSFNLR